MGISNYIVIIISYNLHDLESLSFYKCHLCESTRVISFELELAWSQFLTAGVSFLQENLNYSSVLYVICQIFPQLQSYRL